MGPSPKTAKRAVATILLAEDEALLRELGQTILTQAGYKVVTAPGAPELRSMVESYSDPVDLLLTDVVMPGLSGQELARLARQRWPKVRVLYTSGYPGNDLEDLLSDSAFLQKPFTPSELMGKVKELIGS